MRFLLCTNKKKYFFSSRCASLLPAEYIIIHHSQVHVVRLMANRCENSINCACFAPDVSILESFEVSTGVGLDESM
jgi:hypothetical protein